jgi:hypothetical protein
LFHRFIKATVCLIVAALLGVGLGGGGAGCSGQGEGERCTHYNNPDGDINGNSECQSGLFCTPAFNIAITGDFDRCCPQNLEDPQNVLACFSPGGNSSPPTDAGIEADAPEVETMDGPHPDGHTEAAHTDAPADGKPVMDGTVMMDGSPPG